LCQQRTQPGGRLDGPRARREASGEAEQLVSLPSVRTDSQLADHGLAAVEHRRGVGPLVGVDPDDEHEALLVAQPVVMPRRALLMRDDCSRLFRATPQREPDERPLRSEANQQPVGRAFLRPSAELAEATTTRSSVRSDNHQGNMRCDRVGESPVIEVHRLHLTDVTPAPNLPWTRPTFPVFAYLVLHPTGSILIDTGVGIGNRLIDELYSPVHHDIDDALGRHGVGIDDVATVITSHLHFDHCGQNNRFAGSTILVQRAEVEAATAARYTVPDWAFPPHIDLALIEGDHQIATGVRVIATPGHTPGHMSVWIESGGDELVVLGDVVVHEAQVADPDLVYVSDTDAWQAACTRKQLLGELAAEPVPTTVSHFNGAGRFVRAGAGFAWKPL